MKTSGSSTQRCSPCCPSLFALALKAGGGPNKIVVADYVVVGAGTAGAPFAHFRSLGSSVHLIEGGQRHNDDPLVLDPNPFPQYAMVNLHWLYPADIADIAAPSFLMPQVPFLEGRGWGGSSMHNFMTAVRGAPFTYDRWATLSGSAQWGYSNLLPVMKYMEHYTDNGDVPVDFLSTNDITNGNSGSAVMNGKGELVGLAFDGNYEAMTSDYEFDPKITRAIIVDIRYVIFLLDKVYHANGLLKEMTIR